MFKENPPRPPVSVLLDGQVTSLPGEMSVAAALLARGELITGVSPAGGRPCAPHCLMGVCHECLLEIDGRKRQACLTEVKEGMDIKRDLPENGGNRR